MSPDPLDYESVLKKQVMASRRLGIASRRTRRIARLIYLVVCTVLLFFAVRYMMRYFDLINSLTQQRTQ